MDDEIQLISDGDGLAVIGDAADVDRFLSNEGLLGQSIQLPGLSSALRLGSIAAESGSEISANSGRWMKMTKESAKLVKDHGLRQSKSGVSTGVIKGPKGQIKGFVEFSKGSIVNNPAVLAGAAGLMAQLSMQQAIKEITDYLAAIDEKVDDVLRAQEDAVLAQMIGTGLVIDEAMTIRKHQGRVDEVTWSKIQASPATIAETQAYALRQLDGLAGKLERKTRIGDLADVAHEVAAKAQEWLAVLARCFQLQDAITVIELDRVLAAAPDDLDGHRLGLRAAREDRLALIARTTERLLTRMINAAEKANANVLMHPAKSHEVVSSSNDVAVAIIDFHKRLGIEIDRQSLEARPWADAFTELRVDVIEAGADGVGRAKRLGGEGADRARHAWGQLSQKIAEQPGKNRTTEHPQEED